MFCLSLTSRSTQNKFQDSYIPSLTGCYIFNNSHTSLHSCQAMHICDHSDLLHPSQYDCVPLRITSMATSRSFSSVAPEIWNALPGHLSSIPTLPPFRRCLEHHFVLRAHPGSRTPGGNSPSERITLPDTTPCTCCHRTIGKYHAVQLNAFHLSAYD